MIILGKAAAIVFLFTFVALRGGVAFGENAKGDTLEINIDASARGTALSAVFVPGIDLSGRGFHADASWPQSLAAPQTIDRWQKEVGFSGVYRLQYNLWEIDQLAKDKEAHQRLLDNYEALLQRITDAGGIAILNIFGSPRGQGKVLDKKSSPVDIRAFKSLIKEHIRRLSCTKRFTVWYEVWNAPDLEEFYLGKQNEYLNLYRAVAEAVLELEAETKVHIPVGGPSSSWWFRGFGPTSILTAERSLIYELIRFCYHYKLPLNFISWHAYSTDPKAEREMTVYKQESVAMVKRWLSYFSFDPGIPLIVDEWNYDSGTNVLSERREQAHIAASYIPARLQQMAAAGVSYQTFFALEDFQDNKEGVVRNVGVFSFTPGTSGYSGQAKSMFDVFRMLACLGKTRLPVQSRPASDYIGGVATRNKDEIAVLLYNYADPDSARNFISRGIALLGAGERNILVSLAKNGKMDAVLRGETGSDSLRAPSKIKNLLFKARQIAQQADKYAVQPQTVSIAVKKLPGTCYSVCDFRLTAACGSECPFVPQQEQTVCVSGQEYRWTVEMEPYSVRLFVLKPVSPEAAAPAQQEPIPSLQNNDTAAGQPQE